MKNNVIKLGLRLMLTGLFIMVTNGCFSATKQIDDKKPNEVIGTASMNAKEIIRVRIRMDADGAVGDTSYEVGPGDPRYKVILERVGGLKPGEEKFIPSAEK